MAQLWLTKHRIYDNRQSDTYVGSESMKISYVYTVFVYIRSSESLKVVICGSTISTHNPNISNSNKSAGLCGDDNRCDLKFYWCFSVAILIHNIKSWNNPQQHMQRCPRRQCNNIFGSHAQWGVVISRPIAQIPKCTCPISHNAPFRTEMCPFLFWIVHGGIWTWCIVGFFCELGQFYAKYIDTAYSSSAGTELGVSIVSSSSDLWDTLIVAWWRHRGT